MSTPKLSAPTGLTAEINGLAVTLAWEASENATQYQYENKEGPQGFVTGTSVTVDQPEPYDYWKVFAAGPGFRTSAPIGIEVAVQAPPVPPPVPTPPAPEPPVPPTPPAPSGSTLATFFGPEFDSTKAFAEFVHQNYSIADGILTVSYPKGSTAPSMGAPYGGAQICLPFVGGPKREVTLSYQIRIPTGFDWVKGGKLPGLYGGVEPFSGGGHNAAGWSARIMWRPGQETPANEMGPTAVAEIYEYFTAASGYGVDAKETGRSFKADGEWHTVSESLTLNTLGNSDGSTSLSIDGVVIVDQRGLSITDTDTQIGGLFFSSFFGGHDPSWAPPTDCAIDFQNFSVA